MSKLKDIRMEKHLSQKELADSVGIAATTISRIESGEKPVRNLSLDTAIKIANVLEVKDLRELVDNE